MPGKDNSQRENVVLALVAVAIGAACAGGYGAWRAVSREGGTAADRWGELGDAMVFPGLLIIAAVAAMIWLGWKANID